MSGVIVFDDQQATGLVDTPSGHSSVLIDGGTDVFVFETERRITEDLVGDPSQDFVLFDAPRRVEVVQNEQDFLVVTNPKQPATVFSEDAEADLLVLTPGGPPGPPGPQGLVGPQGLDGAGAYYQVFGFASPANIWTIVHNRGTYALSVELFDTSGEPMEGNVRYVDQNTIEVDWYYPTAGEARLFR